MKLNKELIKKGFKNQFMIILNMIGFNIISLILFLASFIGVTPTGDTIGTGFLPITEYRLNLFFSTFFFILFLIFFINFYKKSVKNVLKEQIAIHWSFVLLFLVVSIIFICIEFILYSILSLCLIGFFGNVTYNSIYVVLLFIIVYIVIDLVKEIIFYKKNN